MSDDRRRGGEPRPKAVLFDFHDTLAELIGGTERVVAQRLGIPVDVLRIGMAEVFAHHVPTLRRDGIWPKQPDVMFHRLYEALFDVLGLDRDPTSDVDHLNEVFWSPTSYRAYPDVRPVLDHLHGAGLRLGLVSNSDFDLHPVLDHIGLDGLVDVAVAAFLYGVEKPDRAAFEIALDGLGVAAPDCWFVGDHPEFDAVAADVLGMTAVLVDREDRHAGAGWPFPRIRDLTPLPDMLGL
ncbi:MAG TPA: HAD-IA family hydrolase [Acidimicrobiia bacterium]|nr:HAD-IA family hydrolase [Acidimicrobiia bacterium]